MEEKSPSAACPVCGPEGAFSPGDTSRAFPQGPAGATKEADLQGKMSMWESAVLK